jgi:hypothetical protein
MKWFEMFHNDTLRVLVLGAVHLRLVLQQSRLKAAHFVTLHYIDCGRLAQQFYLWCRCAEQKL